MKTIRILLFSFLVLFVYSSKAQNNSLNFDGVNDYISVPAKASYDLNTGTIECMVRPANFSNGNTILSIRGAGGTRFSFHLENTSIGMWNGALFYPISYTFNTGVWYHLAFVCSGSNSTKIYVNGIFVGD